MGSNPTEGKICFSHFILLGWNVKNCFVKLIKTLKIRVKPRLRRAEAEARGETEADAEAEARRAATRDEPRVLESFYKIL